MSRVLLLLAFAALAPVVSAAEPPAARPLFAENSLAGWKTADGSDAKSGGWSMINGVLTHEMPKCGDLWSAESYADFELSFEWRVTEGANSGVKYRVMNKKNSALGFEYQVLDDAKHKDGQNPRTSAAALYHVIAPNAAKKTHPVGEWNQARIVVRGRHVEHWLNGEKVVDVETSGPAWDAEVAKSKYKTNPDYATAGEGPVVIQDHGDRVSFRNMIIRRL